MDEGDERKVPTSHEDLVAMFGEEHVRAPAKNPKASARRRFNRQKRHLAEAVQGMEDAIAVLEGQPGALYKAGEIATLKSALKDFRAATDLSVSDELTQEQMQHIMDAITAGQPWTPPSEEVQAELRALVEQFRAELLLDLGDEPEHGDEG